MQAVDYTHKPADLEVLALHVSYDRPCSSSASTHLDTFPQYLGISRLLITAHTLGYVSVTRFPGKSDMTETLEIGGQRIKRRRAYAVSCVKGGRTYYPEAGIVDMKSKTESEHLD
jgi:hypothetical protein